MKNKMLAKIQKYLFRLHPNDCSFREDALPEHNYNSITATGF
jgi:hypothetical protein